MKKIVFIFLFLLFIYFLESRPVVMLTGYWPPTNEMIYRFSNDPILNPDGWIGENWENRGYDVYAFFPAFDVSTREFEVDYQATWNDFWLRVEEFHPNIIISFGAGEGPWEIETKAINLINWSPDEIPPYYPTPNPPDSTVAVNTVRYSTLPLENISDAVNEQTDIYAWIDLYGDPGDFLCHYIAYLGMWYQSMHASEDDEFYCKAAGFIHVNETIPVEEAAVAAEITLRATLEYFENLTDLNGCIIANSQLENCVITLTSENGHSFETVADEDGNFIIEDIEFGVYDITALAGRYYYFHQEDFILDSHDTFLWIEMEEYNPTEPLTYSQGANLLINEDIGAFVVTAAYFPTEMLTPYQELHLNTVQFTAPDNSADCSSFLFLYRGNPIVENPTLMYTFSLPEFQSGELVEVWMNDIYYLTDEDLQEGLTLAFGIASTNNNIGYTDNTVANSNGNLVKVGPTWYHADEEYGIQGNWDLKLCFYGPTSNGSSDNVVENSKISLSNYPNPFNPTTTIQFSIPEDSYIELMIYNVKGQKLKTLANKQYIKGTHSIIWDGIDENNTPLSSGLYLYKLNVDGKREVINRCLLLK